MGTPCLCREKRQHGVREEDLSGGEISERVDIIETHTLAFHRTLSVRGNGNRSQVQSRFHGPIAPPPDRRRVRGRLLQDYPLKAWSRQ